MMSNELEILAQHRDDLLRAERAAWLHDAGKLHRDFLSLNPRQPLWAKFHHLVLRRLARGITHIASLQPDRIFNAIREGRKALQTGVVEESLLVKHIRTNAGVSGSQAEILLGEALIEDGFLSSDFLDLLENSVVTIADEKLVAGDLIEEHAIPFFSRRTGQRDNRSNASKILQQADFCDSSADKGAANASQEQGTFVATAFGIEKPVEAPDSLGFSRNLVTNWASRRESIKTIREFYKEALGETRRGANDVTLWDHSYSVASLCKSSLANVVLTGWPSDFRSVCWRLLRVNFDVLGLYAKAVKIADLLAYQQAVDKACKEVKRLVEEEYPLGNEVYRDTTGIYFTFPDLNLPVDLAKEIRRRVEEVEPELAPRIAVTKGDGQTATEQLKSILAKARREALQALAQPFDSQRHPQCEQNQSHELGLQALTQPCDSQNLSDVWQQEWQEMGDGKWEVCPVCRLRPMKEKEKAEACDVCLARRQSRVETWLENPQQTIWMDEIADHNDRVALLVGKFGLDDWLSGDLVQTMLVRAVENDPAACVPKNPSPARLRRVWDTCQRFWIETVEENILAKHPYAQATDNPDLRCLRLFVIPDIAQKWRPHIPYDGTLDGRPLSLLWDEERNHFITIINVQLCAGEAKSAKELIAQWPAHTVEGSDPDNPRQRWSFAVQRVESPQGELATYRPYLTLLASPDQFLAFVPASDALDIAEKIRQEYVHQFGKVQNRLPLFLGLVFFSRKMPLMAVMDTARRMLEQVRLEEEKWTVECSCPSQDRASHRLCLSSEEKRACFDIPLKMGDNSTDDVWYPYFFVAAGTDLSGRRRYFQHNGRWLVHAGELREGDRVFVTPSRFAYIFLESAAQRFCFEPAKHLMLLDDLYRLSEMWETICQPKDMSQTKLQAIRSLFESKWHLWDLDKTDTPDYAARRETFTQLVETTFKREGIQGIYAEQVLNRQFRTCLDLYLHILKRKVPKTKKEA